jgi:hypothetical protein
MIYSDKERLRGGAEVGAEALLESQQNTACCAHAYPKVSREVQLAERREYALDSTLAETFPCSDPLSSIPDPTSHPF